MSLDAEKARQLVHVLSQTSEPVGQKGERKKVVSNERMVKDMELLKELRSSIQRHPGNVDVFSREGIILVLVQKLRDAPDSNQVYLLQILAALGYLVQKSVERIQAAIDAGIFEAIVEKMDNDTTSEGVLLLIVQVVSFLVDESDQNLMMFAKSRGVDACIRVLGRGCIRSSMLNAKVATLLSSVCELIPRKAHVVCNQLFDRIRVCVDKIKQLCENRAGKSSENLVQAIRPYESSCITLTQALGLLLDGKPRRSKVLFDVTFASTFLNLFFLRSFVSTHLLETMCYTLTYALGSDPEKAKIMHKLNAAPLMTKILRSKERLPETLIQAFATLLSHLVDARLLGNDPDAKTEVDQFFSPLVESLRAVLMPVSPESPKNLCQTPQGDRSTPASTTALRSFASFLSSQATNDTVAFSSSRPALENLEVIGGGGVAISSPRSLLGVTQTRGQILSFHCTSNALRVVRRISRIGGQPLEHLVASEAFSVYVELLQKSDSLSEAPKAEILQEVGLLVEHSPQVGLCLAEKGACSELKRIICSCTSSTELCNATRAMACFVEHSTPIGCKITDLALEEGCDSSLIHVLVRSEKSGKIPHEVLLNTVGALGYMVKRQSVQQHTLEHHNLHSSSSSSSSSDLTLPGSPRGRSRSRSTEGTSSEEESRKEYEVASACLCRLLQSDTIGESLTWNSLWALIYLMNGGQSDKCTMAVKESNGVEIFSKIIVQNPQNQPLVCSASKALWHLVANCEEDILHSTPLCVRLKVLACATRSQPVFPTQPSNQDSASPFTTLEIAVDPSNVMHTSLCNLDKFSGEQLRTSALKVQYVSEDYEQVGVDAGGVRRDWLSRLSEELFDPKFNLVISGFHPNDSVQVSPSPAFGGFSEDEQKSWYRLMGRVLALSVLYEDPLGVALVPSFCKLLLEEQPVFEDIKHVSNEYYRTFSLLKELRKTDVATFENSLRDLTFTVNSRECMMAEAFERNGLGTRSSNSESIGLQRQHSFSSFQDQTTRSLVTRYHAQQENEPTSLSLNVDEDFDASKPVAAAESLDDKRIGSADGSSVWEWDSSDDGLSPLPPRPPVALDPPTTSTSCAASNSSSSSDEARVLASCKTLKDVTKQLDKARSAGNRSLIRTLMLLQNEMLQRKSSRTGENEDGEEADEDDDEDEENDAFPADGASADSRPTRKRRLSTSSTCSEREHAAKRFRTGAAKMKRMMSDLMDGGQMERIHPGNFDQYLEMLTFKLLVENVASQIGMIKQGFHEILPRDMVLKLLNAAEFGKLIEGDRTINIDKWKENTITKGGSEQDTPQVRWFWEYASNLSKQDRQKLLMWATGWRSIGNGGFANRSFTIELTNVTTPAEDERLPSVATCGFHMWLPKYSTKEQLEKKFKLAMSETSFGIC